VEAEVAERCAKCCCADGGQPCWSLPKEAITASGGDPPQRLHGSTTDPVTCTAAMDLNTVDDQRIPAEQCSFHGQTIVVDVEDIDRHSEDFQGREWLERMTAESTQVGWGLHWHPDPNKYSDNPVVLMSFACGDTVLALRTHRSQKFLPASVSQALLSTRLKKICAGDQGTFMLKMYRSFDFKPVSLIDVEHLAKQKTIAETNLPSLACQFGFPWVVPSHIWDSDWTTWSLTQMQIQAATEKCNLCHSLFEKIKSFKIRSELELAAGWSEQGMKIKDGWYWCTICESGPMTSANAVELHLAGQKHRKKQEHWSTFGTNGESAPGQPELLADLLAQRIVAVPGSNEYRCECCNAGPFNSIKVIEKHVASKKHQRLVAQESGPLSVVFENEQWNLPEYVTLDVQGAAPILLCTLCGSKSSAMSQMYMHLGGDKHAKKCKHAGFEEIIFSKDKQRLNLQLLDSWCFATVLKNRKEQFNWSLPMEKTSRMSTPSLTCFPQKATLHRK